MNTFFAHHSTVHNGSIRAWVVTVIGVGVVLGIATVVTKRGENK
jgi:hypothetical protein